MQSSNRTCATIFGRVSLLWLLVTSTALNAQTQTVPETSLSAEGLTLEGVTLAPFSRPRPGRPLALHAVISNASTEPRNAVAIAKIDAAPDLQAASNVYVPAKGLRSIELRLHVPANMRPDGVVEISFLIERSPESAACAGGQSWDADDRFAANQYGK